MKSILLDVTRESPLGTEKVDVTLSFKKYIDSLKARIEQEETIRKVFFKMVLDKLEEDPAFLQPISLDQIKSFEEQLSLVYGMLIPSISQEKNILWGLATPISPTIFYGTDGLYELIMESSTGKMKCNMVENEAVNLRQKVLMVYSYILEKLYGFPPAHHNDLIISLFEDNSGLKKYYRINIDTRFVDVFAKGELPEINPENLRRQLQEDNNNIDDLVNALPLSAFRFEGVSVLTLTDVTEEHTLEKLKNTILNRSTFDSKSYFYEISGALKTLVEDPAIDFGMMPLLKVNNKLIFHNSATVHSKLISAATANNLAEKTYLTLANEYFKHPKVIFMRSISDSDEKHEFARILKQDGVKSYALLPVYYDNKICGVLEVFSNKENAINEDVLAKLNPALPLIARIYDNNIAEFHSNIENVIREKFTSLQPAVQWKFKDVAWHYLRDKAEKSQGAMIESIDFKDVYPLYGAIDIRNSTIERNAALREDLRLQFTVLIETFSVLKQKLGFGLADEMVFKCKKMINKIMDETLDNDEMKIRDFLESDVHPFLLHFKENKVREDAKVLALAGSDDQSYEYDEIGEAIDKYFEIIDEQNGAAFAQRRALESSMQMINSSVNVYLDLFKTEIQQSYPTYFEKFRTDGIEYDIYIGQSIEPEKPFNNLYLKNIRLWQLTSMAAIAKITNSLLPNMEKQLLTTQLIFINSGTIDISFRDDERRFDVEGAYNIRYQVIKKRIDKVHVKGTGERLTQPGKISMVYFNNKSAEEYVDYIRYLQEQNTLLNDLEYLDLEELQGVNGLRALRVGVNLDSEWK